MNQINPSAMFALITALRNGEVTGGNEEPIHITQGFGALRPHPTSEPNELCVLGVACEVYRRIVGHSEWQGAYFFVLDKPSGQVLAGESASLPNVVCDWFGVEHHIVVKYDKPYRGILSTTVTVGVLNDNYRLSFNEIAELLATEYGFTVKSD